MQILAPPPSLFFEFRGIYWVFIMGFFLKIFSADWKALEEHLGALEAKASDSFGLFMCMPITPSF